VRAGLLPHSIQNLRRRRRQRQHRHPRLDGVLPTGVSSTPSTSLARWPLSRSPRPRQVPIACCACEPRRWARAVAWLSGGTAGCGQAGEPTGRPAAWTVSRSCLAQTGYKCSIPGASGNRPQWRKRHPGGRLGGDVPQLVPSAPAVARVLPSGLKATADISFPSGGPIWAWVAMSHFRAVPSMPAVARVLPSGLTATAPTPLPGNPVASYATHTPSPPTS
jgi:hypothetical protein